MPPGTADAGLVAYIALPATARAQDLLISHSRRGTGGFWAASEYQRDGKTLPYCADYIVHFASTGPDSTRVQLFGIGAVVADGTEWRTAAAQDGLGLPWPRKFDKQRPVLPSLADKQAVLAALAKVLKVLK